MVTQGLPTLDIDTVHALDASPPVSDDHIVIANQTYVLEFRATHGPFSDTEVFELEVMDWLAEVEFDPNFNGEIKNVFKRNTWNETTPEQAGFWEFRIWVGVYFPPGTNPQFPSLPPGASSLVPGVFTTIAIIVGIFLAGAAVGSLLIHPANVKYGIAGIGLMFNPEHGSFGEAFSEPPPEPPKIPSGFEVALVLGTVGYIISSIKS